MSAVNKPRQRTLTGELNWRGDRTSRAVYSIARGPRATIARRPWTSGTGPSRGANVTLSKPRKPRKPLQADLGAAAC